MQTKIEHDFKVHDHVIWETDTPPQQVCYLEKKHARGFIASDGDIIHHEQLTTARKATGSEIRKHYIDMVNE